MENILTYEEIQKVKKTLKYSDKTIDEANWVYNLLYKKYLTIGTSKNIPGIIYVAGLINGERNIQKIVADYFNISTVSLRKQYRYIKRILTNEKIISGINYEV